MKALSVFGLILFFSTPFAHSKDEQGYLATGASLTQIQIDQKEWDRLVNHFQTTFELAAKGGGFNVEVSAKVIAQNFKTKTTNDRVYGFSVDNYTSEEDSVDQAAAIFFNQPTGHLVQKFWTIFLDSRLDEKYAPQVKSAVLYYLTNAPEWKTEVPDLLMKYGEMISEKTGEKAKPKVVFLNAETKK